MLVKALRHSKYLLAECKYSHTSKRFTHNYDEIYDRTKALFQCKFPNAFNQSVRTDCRLFNCLLLAKKLPKDVNKTAVFACNELDLDEIQIYGFDYDYTLANYKPSLHYLLYGLGRDMLIEKYKVEVPFSVYTFFCLFVFFCEPRFVITFPNFFPQFCKFCKIFKKTPSLVRYYSFEFKE